MALLPPSSYPSTPLGSWCPPSPPCGTPPLMARCWPATGRFSRVEPPMKQLWAPCSDYNRLPLFSTVYLSFLTCLLVIFCVIFVIPTALASIFKLFFIEALAMNVTVIFYCFCGLVIVGWLVIERAGRCNFNSMTLQPVSATCHNINKPLGDNIYLPSNWQLNKILCT